MHQLNRPDARDDRWVVWIVAALLLLPWSIAGAAAEKPLPKPPSIDLSTKSVHQVVDVRAGNVIVVQLAGERRTVRMVGVYVPKAGTDEDAARPFIKRMLMGEYVHVEYEPDWPLQDRSGRYWAYVYRAPDGLLVNLELLRQGYGRLSAVAPFERQKLFRAYEQFARKHDKGLWAPTDKEQPTTAPADLTKVSHVEPKKEPKPDAVEITVYVTASGTKYHRKECHFAKTNGISMTLTEAKVQGYTPCKQCRPPE